MNYCVIDEQLFWKDTRSVLCKCVDADEAKMITDEFHSDACGGQHYYKTISHKISRDRYYCPILFSNANAKVRVCMECQMFSSKQKFLHFPLKPIIVKSYFQQW